ncbi:MAG: arginine--tRNA ligase [bacterium]|nr:arginine--tRNA ligase [bacterium]
MIQEKIKKLITQSLKNLGIEVEEVVLEHPGDMLMGDYSTSVAMVLAKSAKTNPKELAGKITDEINQKLPKEITRVESVNGFINFYLSSKFFANATKEILKEKDFGKNKNLKKKKIMVEHTDPNPFKEFHVGHLMPNVIGSTVGRILEWNGAEVKQACYQGDVGLHVAKAVWGFMRMKDWATAYAYGSKTYEEDENIRTEVAEINKKIYAKDREIMPIYEAGKKLSLENFEKMYARLGTHFDYYFFESEASEFGRKVVENKVGTIFARGEGGATIFKGERYDQNLHTRVFINKDGLPTYEAKELGLAKIKYDKYKYDQSIIITGNEIDAYFKVLLCAMKQIFPELAEKTLHFSHGMLRLPTGKMSSRTGDVITALGLIDKVKEKVKGDEAVAIGAIKYMILRSSIGGDIIFDIDKSISTEGDSGVYLQYSYARANAILEKAKEEKVKLNTKIPDVWQTLEVEKLLYRFPEVVERAGQDFAPHYIVNYLTELARAYNSFYGNAQIVKHDDPASPYKIALSEAFSVVMKNGLNILCITAPERM